ncbi:MAG TPA: BCCT family transporter [Nocardioidaceae bacterium]|nr:BCCT family transporter [Nocardioidaceae bacterium]
MRADQQDPSTSVAEPSEDETAGDAMRASSGIDWLVFGVTAVASLAFIAWGVIDKQSLGAHAADGRNWVIDNGGWMFVLLASMFVIFVLWLAASRYGKIPLGRDDEKPEFRTSSWIAMMFSAGMGIGLMFWGVAEPLTYYVMEKGPVGGAPASFPDPNTNEAMHNAMATTLFHWTLHPWAIYAVVGLAIAYGTFRKGRPQLISAAFRPILGRHADGPGGRAIDMMAIFATLFGSAASLGFGALQIGAGMEVNGWVDAVGKGSLVLIITVLTLAFVLSAVSGVERGIQWLSNINMVLALFLATFVFIAGPTLLMLNLLPTSVGDFAGQLPEMASRTDASGGGVMASWLSSWTIFYWAWWISWTPFVGMFIARISRGRTIRQFVTGVLLVPSLVSLVWFAIFGGAGIHQQGESGDLTESEGVVNSNFALFHLLDHYPIQSITTVLVMLLVGIFFVSGADAASIVMGTLSERGSIEPNKLTVIFWGAATGAVAAIMLVIANLETGDALTGLQNLTTVVALPFALVMGALCVSLYKDLRSDPIILREDKGTLLVEDAVETGLEKHGDDFGLVVEPVESNDTDKSSSNGDRVSESAERI